MSEKNIFGKIKRSIFKGNKDNKKLSILEEEKVQSPSKTAFKNFIHNKVAMLGLIVFVLIFSLCFILPIFYPLDTSFQDPTQINVPPGNTIMNVPSSINGKALTVDGGSAFGSALNKDGGLYLYGNLSDKLVKNAPKKSDYGKMVQVSAGLDHVLALNDQNELFAWGYDRLGATKIPASLKNTKIVDIQAGYQISVVLDDEGNLTVFGNESIIEISTRSVQGNVAEFTLNTTTAMVITKDKEVFSLTKKDTPFNAVPDSIQGHAVKIASTDKSAAVITDDKNVVVWGSKDYNVYDIPERIQGHAVDIVAGRGHFTVLLDDGTVESWGLNNQRQANAPNLKDITFITADYYQNYAIDENGNIFKWGLSGYLMGTDNLGRDVFVRLIEGGKITMTVGAIAVVISAIIGILIGGLAGFYGGKLDIILMRFAEVVSSIPFIPLAIILSAFLRERIPKDLPAATVDLYRMILIMVILGVLTWQGLAKLVRASILSERENEFVTAAKAMGIKEGIIIFKHILPNVIALIIVNLTLGFATCMLTESSLSFLGFGVVEPRPSWGNMLMGCMDSVVISNYWWRWVFPSLALGLSTISINLVGDGLRDAIDPKSNER